MKDVVEIKSLFRESEKYADQEIVVRGLGQNKSADPINLDS